MDYAGTIDYILSLQKQGIKLGLEKMQTMTQLFGNPERAFRCIHVAGTNGKGSVSAMAAALLREHGLSVGLYTSPHLVSFTERIRINDEPIAETDVVRLAGYAREVVEHESGVPGPTFFEFATVLAFLYFREQQVDWAVLETGMGGRLDATNVILPEVSVITRISIDHQEYLGQTLADITREKAGIMKRGIPVISAAQDPAVRAVLTAHAADQGCPLAYYGDHFFSTIMQSTLDGLMLEYRAGSQTIGDIPVPLAGRHQAENAAIAISAVNQAMGCVPVTDITCDAAIMQSQLIRSGLAKTRWRGRIEVLDTDPLTMADGAHNPAAAEALAAFVDEHCGDYKVALVIGMLGDKDVAGVMEPLLRRAAAVFLAEPKTERAASVSVLLKAAEQSALPCVMATDVPAAINAARNWCSQQKLDAKKGMILITGSLYTVGEACGMFGAESILGMLREQR